MTTYNSSRPTKSLPGGTWNGGGRVVRDTYSYASASATAARTGGTVYYNRGSWVVVR